MKILFTVVLCLLSMPRGVWVAQGWQSTHVKYRTEGGVVRQLFLQLQIDLVAQLTNI